MFVDFLNTLSSQSVSLFQSGYTYTDLLLNSIHQYTETYPIGFAGIFLIISIIGCFFGYKYTKIFTAICSFIAGAIIGILFSVCFLNVPDGIAILCGFIGGLLLSFITSIKTEFGTFILCFSLAFTLAIRYIPMNSNTEFIMCVCFALIIGALSTKFKQKAIIITTAVVFGNIAAKSLIIISPYIGLSFFYETYARLVSFIVLAALGCAFQFYMIDYEAKKKSAKK